MENKAHKYLILGASSDLAKKLIEEVCSKEKDITIIAHYNSNREKIDEVKAMYKESVIKPIQADLSKTESTRQMIEEICQNGVYPDHIISFCADKFKYNRMTDWDVNSVEHDMTIQVYSFAEILKAFLPEMAKNEYGKIVAMLSSVTLGAPPANLSQYVTVKYALMGLIKSVAKDYGELGININGISPGMIETGFINGLGRKLKEISVENSFRKRLLQVDDVIPAVLYLLSDDAKSVNGINLNLSGYSD